MRLGNAANTTVMIMREKIVYPESEIACAQFDVVVIGVAVASERKWQ